MRHTYSVTSADSVHLEKPSCFVAHCCSTTQTRCTMRSILFPAHNRWLYVTRRCAITVYANGGVSRANVFLGACRNETRRVAIVLLTDFPEAENAFPSGLVKLTMIVQATIAVAMIIAFLTCLCMCRMMYLLKSR